MEHKLNLKSYLLTVYFIFTLFPLWIYINIIADFIKNSTFEIYFVYLNLAFVIPLILGILSHSVKTSNKTRFITISIISAVIYWILIVNYPFPYYSMCDININPSPEPGCGFAGAAMIGTAMFLLSGFVYIPWGSYIGIKFMNNLRNRFK